MFRTTVVPMIAALALTTIGFVKTASADESRTTSIKIAGMHCPGCAKKVATRLRAVAGVADAQVSIETESAVITPKDRANPSPRSLWESVEKAGYTPTKLVGPGGTFTKKPDR